MNHTNWGPWKPVRGKCQAYRREQQSCNAYFAATEPGAALYGQMPQEQSSGSSSTGSDSGSGRLSKGSGEVQQAEWLDSTAVDRVGSAEGAGGGVRSRRQLLSVESYHSNGEPSQGSLQPCSLLDSMHACLGAS